jgi:hypothetical protein
MKRIAFGLVLFGCLAAPAYAEDLSNPYIKTQETIRKEGEAIDKQYQRTLNATRGSAPAPVKSDPWAKIRDNDSAKSK